MKKRVFEAEKAVRQKKYMFAAEKSAACKLHPSLVQRPRQSLLQRKGRGKGREKGGKFREVEEDEEPAEAEESQEPEGQGGNLAIKSLQ